MIELDLFVSRGTFELRVGARLPARAAVFGPSGAGKSTLLAALAGALPARGRAVVRGTALQDDDCRVRLPIERRGVGWVPQGGGLFPHLTVRRNLVFGMSGADSGLEEVAERLGLTALLDRLPGELSGGEARRVAFGRAILSRPRLLLLDEPTAGLDAARAADVLGLLRRLGRELDLPWIVVTHRRDEAISLSEEVLLLDGGRVRAVGPTRSLLARPTTDGREVPDNVVAAWVREHDSHRGVTWGELAGGERFALPLDEGLAVGAEVLLAVAPDEVLVSTREPQGLSARNLLVGLIDEHVAGRSGSMWLRVGELWAHLTADAVDDLGLAVGQPVWLVVKTHAVRVVAR